MSIISVPVTVPPSGDGPVASIADLVGAKTVTLTGLFEGAYVLLASHDDTTFDNTPMRRFGPASGPTTTKKVARPSVSGSSASGSFWREGVQLSHFTSSTSYSPTSNTGLLSVGTTL